MATFWIILLRDPATGYIRPFIHGHNATADYKNLPDYIGTKKIEIELDNNYNIL